MKKEYRNFQNCKDKNLDVLNNFVILDQNYFDIFQMQFYRFIFILLPAFIDQNYEAMIEGATFSMEESEKILQLYLKNFDIEKVYAQFKRRDKHHLREHLVRIIRETIISIEAHMYNAQKISKLTLYDQQSTQMFDAFMNLERIIPETQKQNFLLNFRKMKEEGCRMFRKGKTQFYVEISTDERQKIYSNFLKFAEQNDLFKYAICARQDPTVQTRPFSQPGQVYPQRDLQLVYRAYNKFRGNLKEMEKFFREKQIKESAFFGRQLEDNIYNLKLIGNYVNYRKGAQAGNYQGIRWLQFRDRYPVSEDWDFKIQLMLLRIGIRQDPTKDELRYITRLQSRKYIQRRPMDKVFSQQDYWKMQFDDVLSKIKGEMKKVMVVQKKQTRSSKPLLFQRKSQSSYQTDLQSYSQILRPFQMKAKKDGNSFGLQNGENIDYDEMLGIWQKQRSADRFTMQKKLFKMAQKHIENIRINGDRKNDH